MAVPAPLAGHRPALEERGVNDHATPAPHPGRAAHRPGLVGADVSERIQTDVKAEIDSGVQYTRSAPYPDAKQVDGDVYA